jgi:uncharacterized protein DUF1839
VTRHRVLPGLDPATYRRHMLHADERVWLEKNCYVDICIEVIHALGLEPLAAMGFCAAVDFEGDCFTFFKPLHDELRDLFGLDIQELNVWQSLLEHASHHLAAGKFLSTEADAYHLPDTVGTDYRRNHVKTTIIMADLDVDGRRLGYFHNAGYYVLEDEDFANLFRIGATPDPTFLPLFAELLRVDRVVRRPDHELAQMARSLLAKHVERRPATNPVTRFESCIAQQLASIQERGLDYYHAWAFATVRQLGAAFELLSLHLKWLGGPEGGGGLARAAGEFEQLSVAAKAFILKAARAVNTRKTLDASGTFGEMSEAWDRGMAALAAELDARPAGRSS